VDQRIEVRGAFALVRIGSHQQNDDVRIIARGGERERNAVHQRHPDIGEQQIETALLARDYLERVGPIDRGYHLVPGIGQSTRREGAQRFFVLGKQDARHQFFSTTPTNGNWR